MLEGCTPVFSIVQLGSSETSLYKAIRDPIVEYGYLDVVTASAIYVSH
jgi:hypothetical protein